MLLDCNFVDFGFITPGVDRVGFSYGCYRSRFQESRTFFQVLQTDSGKYQKTFMEEERSLNPMVIKDFFKERRVFSFMAKNLGAAGLIALGSMWTYTHHTSLQRLEDSLFRSNIPIREGYFPDPAGISIRIEISKEGYKAGYLVHEDSSVRYPLESDLLPDTHYVVDRLKERAKTMGRDEVKETLERLLEVEKALYRRL